MSPPPAAIGSESVCHGSVCVAVDVLAAVVTLIILPGTLTNSPFTSHLSRVIVSRNARFSSGKFAFMFVVVTVVCVAAVSGVLSSAGAASGSGLSGFGA